GSAVRQTGSAPALRAAGLAATDPGQPSSRTPPPDDAGRPGGARRAGEHGPASARLRTAGGSRPAAVAARVRAATPARGHTHASAPSDVHHGGGRHRRRRALAAGDRLARAGPTSRPAGTARSGG